MPSRTRPGGDVQQQPALAEATTEPRQAEMEVRRARVTLRPPRRANRKLPAVTVNVVLV